MRSAGDEAELYVGWELVKGACSKVALSLAVSDDDRTLTLPTTDNFVKLGSEELEYED